MFKKIAVEHLRLGMYIHALCGPWLSHPFWRSAFLLDSPQDLHKLQHGALKEVWIDTSRGLDVEHASTQVAQDSAPRMLDDTDTTPTPLGKELKRAIELCEASREAVMNMFNEARMGQAINPNLAVKLVEEFTGSIARNPDALLSVARLKTADNYTYMHSVAVSALMVALARKLGHSDSQISQAGMVGLLHDIGKARMNPDILNKPGPLTDEEFAHMKGHPSEGYAMLQHSIDDQDVLDACLHHHERMDGKGYPDALPAERISLLARMATICDVYDAVTSNRPYKSGWSPSLALQRMAEWCTSHLDRSLFEVFVKTIGIYPVGSMVRLASGQLALVYAPSAGSMSTPHVVAFYDTTTRKVINPPAMIDLSVVHDERIVALEEASDWPFTNVDALWKKAAQMAAHNDPAAQSA